MVQQTAHFIGIICLLLIVLCVSKTSLYTYFRHIVLLSWLLIFTFLANLWGNTTPGSGRTVLNEFSIFGLSLMYEEIWQSVLILGQLVVVVGWVTILASTSSPLEIVNGIESLLHPGRRIGLPVQKLTIIAMLSIRFLPIIFQERAQLAQAYIARGIDLKQGHIFVRLKNYAELCIPLLSSMLRRVEHISLAMEVRAFKAETARTSFYELRLHCIDYVVLGVSVLIILWIRFF